MVAGLTKSYSFEDANQIIFRHCGRFCKESKEYLVNFFSGILISQPRVTGWAPESLASGVENSARGTLCGPWGHWRDLQPTPV